MPKVTNYPFNSTWAQETSNKLSFTETEIQNGIAYKGSVVSNQLNGVSHILSQALQFQQCSGGVYSSTMTYLKGNFVTILRTTATTALQAEVYYCINDKDGNGITNQPPVLDATLYSNNGVDYYSGGYVNRTHWQRVDVGQMNEIEAQEVISPQLTNGLYVTELCTIPSALDSLDKTIFVKTLQADVWVTTYLGTKSCSVNLKLEAQYVLNKDKNAYLHAYDVNGYPVPNVSFGEITFRDSANNNSSVIPITTPTTIGSSLQYGFNVWIGYTTSDTGAKTWAIFLAFSNADKITLHGKSNIALSISKKKVSSLITNSKTLTPSPNWVQTDMGAKNLKAGVLTLTGSGTIPTPSITAQGKEIVNAEWARNFLSSGNGDVGAGYKIYTAVIDLMSAQKNAGSWDTSYVYFMDDAASLRAYSQEAERMALFGIYPCLFVNGAESTKLNPSNFAQNTSGASVDITTLGNDVMIKFPRMGLRIRQKGSLLYIQFTDDPNAKDFSYAAFQRERTANQGQPVTKNAFYWGAYKAYLANSKMYSSSGKTATAGQALSTFRAQAQARGDGYAAASWFQWVYIQAVCIFVKASINSFYSRPGFGYTQNTTMPATGTANAYGMRNENLTSAQLSGRAHQAKFLGIEDIWGAQPEWRDGIIVRAYQLMVTQGIAACNNDGAGYSELGMFYNGAVDAFTASFAGNDFAGFYPASTKSTWDGVPNGVKGGRFIQGNGTFGVGVGGVWNLGYLPYGTGLFSLNANIATTTAGGGYTSRLMYI